MTLIESSTIINKPIAEVYQFLLDLNNHQQLMPSNIYNWSSTSDEASFTIQNMAKLSIKISEKTENKEIIAVPTEKAPFELKLKWEVSSNADQTTTAKHVIEADLNMMMKMIASGPLQKLVNYETNKLKEVLG